MSNNILNDIGSIFLHTKPTHYLIAAAIIIVLILILALSIRATRKRRATTHRPQKKCVFRKILIVLLVLALITTIGCAFLCFAVRNGNITETTVNEAREVSTRYLYSLNREGETYYYFYYAGNGLQQGSIPAKDATIQVIADATAPRVVEYEATPMEREFYKGQLISERRVGEIKIIWTIYVPQSAIQQSFNVY